MSDAIDRFSDMSSSISCDNKVGVISRLRTSCKAEGGCPNLERPKTGKRDRPFIALFNNLIHKFL